MNHALECYDAANKHDLWLEEGESIVLRWRGHVEIKPFLSWRFVIRLPLSILRNLRVLEIRRCPCEKNDLQVRISITEAK